MVALPLRKYWQPLVRKWDALHVERHGKYSVERACRYTVYCERTSLARTVAVLTLTPMPCLVIGLAVDLLPLEAPERGIEHSAMFWLRLLLVSWLILFAVMKQCRHFIARLPMLMAEIIVASFLVAAGATASAFYISLMIGFPLPFTIGLESPAAFVLLVAAMLVLWGKHLRRSKSLRRELFNYVLVIVTQLTFTYVYPAYNFVFRTLDPLPQVAFALLLPVIKIIAKNWMSFLLQDLEDLKPEFIIFNIEVFHALFVSSCMQSAASFSTTMILMGTDFVFGALALRRILKTIRKFHTSLGALSSRRRPEPTQSTDVHAAVVSWGDIHFLKVAMYILETDPSVLGSKAMNVYSEGAVRKFGQIRPNEVASPAPAHASNNNNRSELTTRSGRASRSISSCVQGSESNNSGERADSDEAMKVDHAHGPNIPQLQSMLQPRQNQSRLVQLGRPHSARIQIDTVRLAAKLSTHDMALVAALDGHDRLCYVQHVLRLLFWVEFILLIEFTEVVVPVVYSTYLALVFHFPAKSYHSQLQDIDTATLHENLSRILLYAALEAFTLVCMALMLRRKLKISTVRQLAFVLESQWPEVQAKLILWFVFSLQSTVVHYGVDFTFKFLWLDKASSSAGGAGG